MRCWWGIAASPLLMNNTVFMRLQKLLWKTAMAIGGKWSIAGGHSSGMSLPAPPPTHNQSRRIKRARHCVLLHDWWLSTRAAQGRSITFKDSCTFWCRKWSSHYRLGGWSDLSWLAMLDQAQKGRAMLPNRFKRILRAVLLEWKIILILSFLRRSQSMISLWQHGIILKYGNHVIEISTNEIQSIVSQMTSNADNRVQIIIP